MPDPKPSLVEVLRAARSKMHEPRSNYAEGRFDAFGDATMIAAPYAARLGALEKVADCALAVVALPLAMREALDDLRRALAAVPEIPEKTDG